MKREVVRRERGPAPLGPYSQAIAVGDLVFCAGQVGVDPATGALVPGGAVAELTRAIANLAAVLTDAGCGLADVVKTTLFVTDLAEAPALNACYAERMPTPPPVRSTVAVAALPAGAAVEIEAIAVRPDA